MSEKYPKIDVDHLASARLFQGLSAEALEKVAGNAKYIKRDINEYFFRQGELADKVFVLGEGQVKVSKITPEGHQIVARYVKPGDVFGCVPLFGGSKYPGTATAANSCFCWKWDSKTLYKLMETFPKIAINALELLGEELAHIRNRYTELATERVERRVAHSVLRLGKQAGKEIAGGVLIEFPLSRQDLAELSGTTLHTVSRILSEWETRGLIESGRQRVMIKDPQGLIAIAEDLL